MARRTLSTLRRLDFRLWPVNSGVDVLRLAYSSAAFGSAWAPLAALLSGVVTCFGPCAAPRFIAIVSLAGNSKGSLRWLRIGAFVTGLTLSTTVIAVTTSVLLSIMRYSQVVYIVLAIAMAAFGVRALLDDREHTCAQLGQVENHSLGAALLLGSSFGFVLSPCCTPMLAALAELSAGKFNAGYTLLVLASFALGHAIPLIAASVGVGNVRPLFVGTRMQHAANTVSGALMIALAGYYAVLA